ncbi:MAG: hypothetical protein M0Z54_04000 [Thermaerobacter sp.]|nr:hypothetical protein [Thermaerobacter sp.]
MDSKRRTRLGWVGVGLGAAFLAGGCGLFGAPPHKALPAVHAKQIASHTVSVPGYGFGFQVPRTWRVASPVSGHARWTSAHAHLQVEAWGTKTATWVHAASFVAHQTQLGIPTRGHVAAFAEATVHGWTRLEESWTTKNEDYLLIAFLNGHVANVALFQYAASRLAIGIQVVAHAAQTFQPRV